jgi:hypothetical protein
LRKGADQGREKGREKGHEKKRGHALIDVEIGRDEISVDAYHRKNSTGS